MTRRIFGFMIVAVVLTATLTVLAGVLLTRWELNRQVERNFVRQADALASVIDARPGRSPVYLLGGRRLLLLPDRGASAPAQLARRLRAAATSRRDGEVDTPRGRVRFLVRDTSRGPVVLARRSSLRPGERRAYRGSLLAAGISGVLLSAIASIALSRRLSRPIRRIAEATHAIASGRTGVHVTTESDGELRRLAGAFNTMADGLDAARAKEKQFVMSVSHDLKTPLTGIRGYAEALRDEAVDPATAAEAIEEEAQHLQRLIQDLLDLAQIGRHDFAAERKPVDLADIAEEARRRHAPVADRLDISLESEALGDTGVQADYGRVLQATSNLAENALRSTPPGGTVRITARDHRIEVSDTGPGLDPDDLPHALERYYLHRKYATALPVGTGLGLAIVDELARAMDGRVEVRSTPGAGATFVLELLPAAPAPHGGAC